MKRWRDVAEPAGAAKAERLSSKRRALIESAIAENGLSDVLTAIDRIAKSKWAMGGGERGWQATLKWVLAPGKPAEILDGEHDDFRAAGPQGSGDGLVDAIMRRAKARNAHTDEGGDGFSRAVNRWSNLGDDPRDGFTRALHRDLEACADGEADCEPAAEYADFTEVDDEAAPWP
ncbi:MAG: hypothetical protein C0486_01470 [Erythrobacter sp.]|nr:hypothetical protein [Erythrobacter sp.]MBA4080306.1 hypothetical protein [Erythrobacter sp.]